MFYDAIANAHGLRRDPFKALVVPRPIGWISTLSESGVVNLAPYSYFNAVATNPHVVMFSSGGRKDSMRNAEATGEFVCNLATWELREQMNATSAEVAAETDEMALAGLEAAPSQLVRPPRVKASPVALECRYLQTIRIADLEGTPSDNHVVFGQVVGIHIDDGCIVDGLVDVTRLRPVARLGYMDYAVVETLFSMERPGPEAEPTPRRSAGHAR